MTQTQQLQQFNMPIVDREAIVAAAEALYDQGLPYHNFDHVRSVLSASEKILDQCRQASIPVDEGVVFYALLFHDAGYHEDHIAKGFDTKEAYSADLAESILTQHGLLADTVDKIKQAIICTHFSKSCVSNEDKVVKNSDLSGLRSEYQAFKQTSVRLLEEYNLLHKEQVEWNDWKHMAANRLEKYLDERIFLTRDSFDENGHCIFIEKARDNIEKLLADTLQ